MVAEGTRMTQGFCVFKKNYIDSYPISCKLLGVLSGVDGVYWSVNTVTI